MICSECKKEITEKDPSWSFTYEEGFTFICEDCSKSEPRVYAKYYRDTKKWGFIVE